MKLDAWRNPEDRTRRTTQPEVKIVAEKDRRSRLKRRTTQSEVDIVTEKDGRSHPKIRTTQSEVNIDTMRRKIVSFGQILLSKKF